MAAADPKAAEPLPHETPRTRLRRLRGSDLAPFQAYRGDPAVGRWQGWAPMDDAAAAAFLQDMADSAFCPPGSGSRSASPIATAMC